MWLPDSRRTSGSFSLEREKKIKTEFVQYRPTDWLTELARTYWPRLRLRFPSPPPRHVAPHTPITRALSQPGTLKYV